VRVVFDAVHEAALAGVDFEDGLAVVAWGHGFDGVAFVTSSPLCLREGGFANDVAGFEEVAVGVLGEGAAFNFGDELDVFGDGEVEVGHFEVLQVETAGVVVGKLDVVSEVRRA
jgi:hypothetical protein